MFLSAVSENIYRIVELPARAADVSHLKKLPARFGLDGRLEFVAAGLLFVIQAVLKVWDVFHYRFDSDETQHLHVIWAWTHGLVQYRDVFDNHMPLFQIVCAPLLALLGEHARDLYWMRLLMLPLYFLSLYFLFRIGTLAFSRRIATWSVIAAGCCGKYFFCTTEFRTDDLWTLLWLMAILVVLKGALRWRQAMVAGLLLGLAFAVSMKSTVMLLAFVFAGAIAIASVGGKNMPRHARALTASAFAFLTATAFPSLCVIAFFAMKGLWPHLRYCVFEHNLGSPVAKTDLYSHLLFLAFGLPVILFVTRKVSAAARSPAGAFRRAFLFASTGAYLIFLASFWRHITRQDYLPFYPLAALLGIAGLSALSRRWLEKTLLRPVLLRFSAPAFAATFGLFFGLLPFVPRENDAAVEIRLVRDVLALTKPGEYVFDCKGETVFRPRATFEVFEGLTIDHVYKGEMPDDVPQRCAATHAGIAAMIGRLPKQDRRFVRHTYLSVRGRLLVAGCILNQSSSDNGDAQFQVVIPGEYKVIAARGAAAGMLDGTPYDGARFLAPGVHDFRSASRAPHLAVIWAEAAQRRLKPFPSSHS